jgi:UDP-N-acetylmuramoyl-L-alanyl-D-glutamate--2,6-diaminopimelate ligase
MKSCRKISMPAIFPVAAHTDNVCPGTIFVAICGQHYDGLLYIPQAIAKGASRVVIQQDAVIPEDIALLLTLHAIPLIRVENSRKALAELSAQVAGYPSKKLKILGITGTKGKTTSVYILEALLKKMGKKVARLSTVSNAVNGCELVAHLTTAQPDYLQQFFALCVDQKIEYVVMEIAAQATTFNRIEMIELDGLIFTNLDREHAELYPDMDDYFNAKYRIFDHVKSGMPAIVNADDLYGRRILAQNHAALGFSFQVKDPAYACAHYAQGQLVIEYNGQTNVLCYKGIPGAFNACNLAGVVVLLMKLGFSLDELCKEPFEFPKIPGRLEEYFLPNGARAYIDYAHTPGSFKSLLSVVRGWTDHLIVVFGAGGSKDAIKRPIMGEIAAQLADVVILTTDNPRQEEPAKIVEDILKGIAQKDKVLVELDRARAIEMAYRNSKKGSIIMLLGKGPDEYQIFGTTKIPFSEKGILQSFVK